MNKQPFRWWPLAIIAIIITLMGGRLHAAEATTGVWTTGKPLPTLRSGTVAGVINGKLYVAGGGLGYEAFTTLEIYDPISDTWSPGAPMNTGRVYAMAGVINGKLYVTGGYHDGIGYLTSLEIYDPVSNSWTLGQPAPNGRYQAASAVFNGKLYVMGGWNGLNYDYFRIIDIYDPGSNTWSVGKPMPEVRAGPVIGVMNEKLYVTGWSTNSIDHHLGDFVDIYDPGSDTWSKGKNTPSGHAYGASGVIGGKWYVAGGGYYPATNAVDVYDPGTDTWTTDTPQPTHPSKPAYGVIEGKLYVVGGGTTSLDIYAPGTTIDKTPPNGNITLPIANSTVGLVSLRFTADASDNNGGSGIKQVKFYVFSDGVWHNAGIDASSPYETAWDIPLESSSQQLSFSIDVIDNADNISKNAGGTRIVEFVWSKDNPDPSVKENWVSHRVYLNQRALGKDGDIECNVASMTMVLAMNDIIGTDFNTMAVQANAMYPRVLGSDGQAYVGLMRTELTNQGLKSGNTYNGMSLDNMSDDAAWEVVKQEIDADRPIIIRTAHGVMTSYGHFFVAIGYQESSLVRQVIAYDPFGKWKGTCCNASYDANTTNAESHKGQWVSYDFNKVFGAYLITAHIQNNAKLLHAVSIPSTPPDPFSDEPENPTTYQGIRIDGDPNSEIFLPLVQKK